jgi:hypothetical protein
MKRALGILVVPAMALALSGCEFSFGGPSQERIEQSIIDNYEGEGYEDISVSLEEQEDGGYVGEVQFTVAESGVQRTLACTVEPPEGTEASWQCAPRINDLAQLIVDGYQERGAVDAYAELSAQSDTEYVGYVEYTSGNNGERLRHNCTVSLADGDANWQCAP